MKLLKGLLLLILFLTLAGVGAYAAFNRGLISQETFAQLPTNLSNPFAKPELGMLSQNAGSQFQILSDRTKEVSTHVGAVLGSNIQTNVPDNIQSTVQSTDQNTPIHRRAFDYARYQYCQQVVKEYEEAKTN